MSTVDAPLRPEILAPQPSPVAPPVPLVPRQPGLWSRLAREPKVVTGCLILLAMLFTALIVPALADHDAFDMVARPLIWPGTDARYPFGTDFLGRDVAMGLAQGAAISLLVGFAATAIGLVIGVVVGAAAGYFGGRADRLLSRLIEMVQTVPSFLLIIVLVAILGSSVGMISLCIGLVTWPTIARLVRSEYRTLRSRDFVLAARSLGYSDARIIFTEILPNALAPIIVTGSVMVASAIQTESALSFLGLGDPNRVSWGSMIGVGRDYLRSAWFLTALPGLAIVLSVLALNLLGDGLNDALNPRSIER